MNELENTQRADVYRPILRAREPKAPVTAQAPECNCPDLCQVDHDN
jgi:hypothetical protein